MAQMGILAGAVKGLGQSMVQKSLQNRENSINWLKRQMQMGEYKMKQERNDLLNQKTELEIANLKSGKGGKETERQREIQRMVDMGVDKDRAIKIADGHLKINTDPVSGKSMITDLTTGKAEPITLRRPPEEGAGTATTVGNGKSEKTKPETLWDLAENATGVGASLKRGLTDTAGQMWGKPGEAMSFPDTVEAQSAFDFFRRDMIRAFALNPKYAITEQQIIEKMLPQGMFTNPKTLRGYLQQFDAELVRIINQSASDMDDDQLDAETRREARKSNLYAQRARERLGVSGRSETQDKPGTAPRPGTAQAAEAVPESEKEAIYQKARDAIAKGADPEKVHQRLRDAGLDPGKL